MRNSSIDSSNNSVTPGQFDFVVLFLLWFFLRDGPKNFFVNTQPVTHPFCNGFGTTPIQVERGLMDRCLEDIRHPTPKSTKLVGGFLHILYLSSLFGEDEPILADIFFNRVGSTTNQKSFLDPTWMSQKVGINGERLVMNGIYWGLWLANPNLWS